ncbi:MAG TPA: DNA-processing protein DprA [Spirochaetia bacterium]|nr:DNA-processing protein DprA [Spirochaetia bacterium]
MASSLELQFAVAKISWLTTTEKLLLCRQLENEAQFTALRVCDLENFFRRRIIVRSFSPDSLLREAAADRKILTHKRIQYTFYEDTGYPPQLREIYNPPFLLYYRGKLPDYELPLLGVVGTRRPSGRAAKAAYALGFEAASAGIGIVSGLARGIDGRAHEGNVAGGGRTAAVLGCGIDFVYPASHRDLAARIIENDGAIFSEYSPGVLPLRYHFPARNRILSGLCRGVVVVEAPEHSGALITADYALEQGRDLYVHSDGLSGAVGVGTARLAETGAPVIASAAEVLTDWGLAPRAPEGRAGTADTSLAGRMREELSGALVLHRGDYFRRNLHG